MKRLKLKVIGTSSTTKDLDGRVLNFEWFSFPVRSQVLKGELDDKFYLFDLKSISFCDKGVLLSGFISDDNQNVGRISFKYLS